MNQNTVLGWFDLIGHLLYRIQHPSLRSIVATTCYKAQDFQYIKKDKAEWEKSVKREKKRKHNGKSNLKEKIKQNEKVSKKRK